MNLEIAKFLHEAGIILGVGGVTFYFIIEQLAKKDEPLTQAVKKILPKFASFILLGLVLLIISGIWLSQIEKGHFDPSLLWAKIVVIALLIINAIYRNAVILKKLNTAKPTDASFGSLKKQSAVTGFLGLLLWWAVVVMAVFL